MAGILWLSLFLVIPAAMFGLMFLMSGNGFDLNVSGPASGTPEHKRAMLILVIVATVCMLATCVLT